MKTSKARTPRPLGVGFGIAALLIVGSILATEATATEPSCHTAAPAVPAPSPAGGGEIEQLAIADIPVVDQDGRKLQFYRDLVAGKKVAMNFVFTTCTTICPPMGAHFSKVSKLVAADGRDVKLISVSIDPATDTPARLKAWQQNFGEAPGWTLVTGSKQDITRLLRDLRVYSASPEAHSPVVLLGDAREGRWQRVYGLTPPAELLATLDRLAETKVAAKENGR